MKIKHVVIHGGSAHRDEFMALGIAVHSGLISTNTPVYRRDPEPHELKDRNVLVLDVGMEFNVAKNNFDHHQFDRGTRACAMSVLADNMTVPDTEEELTYHELFKELPWYKATITLDSLGPHALSKELGLEKLPPGLLSPIESGILHSLENTDSPIPETILEVAWNVVEAKVNDALKLRQQLQNLESSATYITIQPAKVSAVVFDGEPFGIDTFRAKNNMDFCVSITADNRGSGWALYRFDDDIRIDFSRLQGDPRVEFAHKGGFYATTKEKIEREELIELVSKAMTS